MLHPSQRVASQRVASHCIALHYTHCTKSDSQHDAVCDPATFSFCDSATEKLFTIQGQHRRSKSIPGARRMHKLSKTEILHLRHVYNRVYTICTRALAIRALLSSLRAGASSASNCLCKAQSSGPNSSKCQADAKTQNRPFVKLTLGASASRT